MSAIDEIKARIDIVELVSETVKLRRTGKNYIGFCPFHSNTRTPAFVVFPDSGSWHCFGQCNEGGDIFGYVMKKEGWDFSETLRYLADRAGVVLEAATPEREEVDEQNERLRRLLEEAVTFYRHQLNNTPPGQSAKEYLHKRGIEAQSLESFELGYAPNSWQAALDYFTAKGYNQAELLESGLLTERQEGEGGYDRFRHRIMFPIRDGMGRMCGFGARILDPNDVPKFLNSPQTPLFDKGRLLYGMHLGRKAVRAQDQVVIVEGYLDVIALHQAGFQNSVSPMGTALSEDQLKFLKRFTRRIVLALDADAAGEKATLRGLEIARQALDKTGEVAFDARGLLRQEARLQADVRVTTLPPGMDPDDVVLRDPQEWRKIIENAKPIVVHVMESLMASQDIEDPKVKRDIAAQVLPLIEDVPNSVERDAYRQRLARLLKVDERSLAGAGTPAVPRSQRRQQARTQEATKPPARELEIRPDKQAYAMEAHCLQMLLRQPDSLYNLDRDLQTGGLSRLSEQDFEFSDHRVMVRLILESLHQEQEDPKLYLQKQMPEELSGLMRKLIAQPSSDGMEQAVLDKDFLRTLINLRLLRVNEGLRQLRFLQEEINTQDALAFTPFQELVPQYIQARSRLEIALKNTLYSDKNK